MTTLISPMKQAKGEGSLRKGSQHWLFFRLVSCLMVPLSWWFLYFLWQHLGASHDTWIASFKSTSNMVLMLFTFITVAFHSFHGVSEVVTDYIPSPGLRSVIYIFLGAIYTALGLTLFLSLLKIYLG